MSDHTDHQVLAALAWLETEHAELRSDVIGLRVELMARMDRLQDTMSAVKDDIGVNMEATEAAQRVNDNSRQDLRSL
jgi:hypothetical protein